MSEVLGGFVVMIVVVVSLLVAAYGPACGESRQLTPPAPAAPATAPAPGVPGAPPFPAGDSIAVPVPDGSAGELALAFLFIGARTVSVDAVGVRLGEALLGLFPADRPKSREDVMPLAELLIESLQRRRLEPYASHRLAAEFASAVSIATTTGSDAEPALAATSSRAGAEAGARLAGADAGDANEVQRGLVRVNDALAAAGLDTAEIVLIQAELRRLVGRPSRALSGVDERSR